MFTGLVEEMGQVLFAGDRDGGFELTISAEDVLQDMKFGDSICVSGVCLSATKFDQNEFTVGLAPETLARTHLGELKPGDAVNLERSVLPTTRMGGHYVQGHVDGKGLVRSISPSGDALDIEIETSRDVMKYIVEKGYVCVDGASLTVVKVGPDWFSLTLIRHTQPLVTLGAAKVGTPVNLEVDIMAKYAEKILAERTVA